MTRHDLIQVFASGATAVNVARAFEQLEQWGFKTEEWMLAGGCFVSWYHCKRANDLDFFPRVRNPYLPTTLSRAKVTAHSNMLLNEKGKPFQFMRRMHPLRTFDFLHTQVGVVYDEPKGDFVWSIRSDSVADALCSRTLVWNPASNPVAALLRVLKFAARGFRKVDLAIETITEYLDKSDPKEILIWLHEVSRDGYPVGAGTEAESRPASSRPVTVPTQDQRLNKFLGCDSDGVYREPNQADDGTINGRFF